MKSVIALSALLTLALLAPRAGAQVMLEVGDCGGPPTATWTCASNTGNAFTLVASFIAPADLHPIGQESILEFVFESPVSAWWHIGTGECRAATALTIAYSSGMPGCVDFFGSVVGGVTGSYQYLIGPLALGEEVGGPLEANRTRLIVRSTVDSLQALQLEPPQAGDQVFLFSVSVRKARTVGTDACAGCATPACPLLRSVTVLQPSLLGSWSASGAGGWGIMLQGGFWDCYVATNRSTWGQVKSQYR